MYYVVDLMYNEKPHPLLHCSLCFVESISGVSPHEAQ